MGQRAGDFVAAGAVADLEHCAVKLFGKTHDIGSQKIGFKLKRASLLDELVGHKAGRSHPQDDEGDLAVFLAVTGDKSRRAGARAPGGRGCAP